MFYPGFFDDAKSDGGYMKERDFGSEKNKIIQKNCSVLKYIKGLISPKPKIATQNPFFRLPGRRGF